MMLTYLERSGFTIINFRNLMYIRELQTALPPGTGNLYLPEVTTSLLLKRPDINRESQDVENLIFRIKADDGYPQDHLMKCGSIFQK